MYKALDIARYILYKYTQMGLPITNLKLQKMLYFVQRESLRENDEAMFKEVIEAWQFGPVVPEVYYRYAGYGGMKIEVFEDPKIYINANDINLIDNVIERYKNQNPWLMVDETHSRGLAWDRACNNCQSFYHPIISLEEIKNYG